MRVKLGLVSLSFAFAVVATGCSDDGRPRILTASITINWTAPDALANIDVTVEIASIAGRNVRGVDVGLYDGPAFDEPALLPLELQLPRDFDPDVAAGSAEQVVLVNVGTTNGELASLCRGGVGRDVVLFLKLSNEAVTDLEAPEEPHKANVSRPMYLTLPCPSADS